MQTRRLCGLALAILVSAAWSQPARGSGPSNAALIAEDLRSFATRMDELAGFEELGLKIPFTDRTPSDLLNLSELLTRSLGDALAGPITTLDELRAAIEGATGAVGGVDVNFANVVVTQSGAPVDVMFDVRASHNAASAPITFIDVDNGIDLNGSSLELNLEWTGSFHFRRDPNQTDPSDVFHLVTAPSLAVTVRAGGTLSAFTDVLGFTEVAVGGAATLDMSISVVFEDPDADGKITLDELQMTSFADLVMVDFVDNPGNDVDMALTMTSALLPGVDATITLQDADPRDGLGNPQVDLKGLADFSNVSPTEVLTGLSELATGLTAAKALSDVQLPFLDLRLAETVEFVEPLIDLIRQQTEAAVVCGTSDADPPSGRITDLAAGDEFYCQATTLRNPVLGSVTWSISNGDVVSGDVADETVGTNPSANVKLKMTADGLPDVRLVFQDPDDPPAELRDVRRLALTAQDLAAKLGDAALSGFDTTLAYNPTTRSLTYRLTKTLPEQDLADVRLDFADRLKARANLCGLVEAAGADVNVTARNIGFDVTFGIILVPDTADITPGDSPNTDDRFFLKVRSGADEHELEADVAVTANVNLTGRIGFVDVTVEGDADANPSGDAFVIGPVDTTQRMFSVDIQPAGGVDVVVDGVTQTITDAIILRDLIENLSTYVVPSVNISMSGGLKVSASLSGVAVPVEGAVAILWPDITSGLPTITPDPLTFDTNLKVFDTSPSIFGTRAVGGNPDELIDASMVFPIDITGRTVRNITDGSRCVISEFLDDTTLACELEGGNANTWTEGDQYEIVGNPLDVLKAILDNLDRLVKLIDGLNSAEGGGGLLPLDQNLPLLGKSPKDLLGFITDVEDVVDMLRNGEQSATMICELDDAAVVDPPLTPQELDDLVGLPMGALIKCKAVTASAATAASWSVIDLSTMDETQVMPPDIPGSVGPSPTPVDITVPGGTLGKDFAIKVSYTSGDGLAQSAELPIRPFSLSALEATIENALGLPEEALMIELTDLPLPGGDGTQDLVVRLGFGECTEGNAACSASARRVPRPGQRLNLGLEDLNLPPFVGLEESGSFGLDYAALAQLDIAVPLTTNLSSDLVKVVDTTRVTLQAGAAADNLSISVNLGPVMTEATGVAKLGANFSLQHSSLGGGAPNGALFGVSDFVNGLTPQLVDDGSVDCGEITIDPDPPTPLVGFACAKLTIDLPGDPMIGFLAPDLSDTDTWTVLAPSDLASAIDVEALAWELLLESFKFLAGQLDSILQGGGPDLSIPLVGKRLDGGAPVCSSVGNEDSDTGLLGALNDLEQLLNDADNPELIRTIIQDKFFDALGDLLLDTNGVGGTTKDDVVVTVTGDGCTGPGNVCTMTDSIIDIGDVRIRFLMGQGTVGTGMGCSTGCVGGEEIDIDVGLPGLPLTLTGKLVTTVGWQLLVDFGMSRDLGPYLVAGGPDHGSEPEMKVAAAVGLGMGSCNTDLDGPFPPDIDTTKYTTDECVAGTLGFLEIVARDAKDGLTGANDPVPTEMELATTLDVTSTSGDQVALAQLVAGQAGVRLGIGFGASADLLFRTGFSGNPKAQLPSVLGTFHMEWDPLGAEFDTMAGGRFEFGGAPDVEFDNLFLDAGAFFSGFVDPLLGDVAKATRPFKPVVDTVRTPLPLISDLSRLVGGPSVSLLTLMEVSNGGKLQMIEKIIELIEFLDSIPADQANFFVALGSGGGGAFTVDGQQMKSAKLTSDRAGKSIMSSDSKKGAMKTSTTRTPSSVAYPFLQDSSQIFAMLMGQDVTLIRYDAGTMRATATLGPFTYCCIPVGPIPVSIFIKGSGTLAGRFAMGYDTVGIRRSFARKQADPGIVLDVLDGVFIDDLDTNGRDVPEITLIGEVSAGAGVDFGVVAGGVEGGVRMTVDLNLDDRPEPDGKLRLDEVVSKISNPICLFEVRGKLDAFLGAWVRVGFEWFSKTWRVEIVNITLLDFRGACNPPSPQPARVSSGDLIVHVGSGDNRRRRRIAVSEIDEDVVVRQLDMAGTRFSVSMFGITEEYGGVSGVIRIDGDDGNDRISLESGVTRVNGVDVEVRFTKNAAINGGSGNDRIKSASGNDVLIGGPGNDKITGDLGNDRIFGDAGTDILTGDLGDDEIHGGPDGDIIMGGPGADRIFGDGGDDDLNGGPGVRDQDGFDVHPDLADRIVGGTGLDRIEGGDGDDVLYGDEELGCNAAGSGSFADRINGGLGDDRIFGGGGDDVIGGEEGDDVICGNGGDDMIDADDRDDRTVDGNDKVFGGPGNDLIFGAGGHDLLDGQADNDNIDGGNDNDDLIGGTGRDILIGGPGRDILLGDNGTIDRHHDAAHNEDDLLDKIMRSEGVAEDTIVADCRVSDEHPTLPGAGDDSDCLIGGDEADLMFGESGNDRMWGDAPEGGIVEMMGESHGDYMEGNGGHDVMRGGVDDDTMFGNSGNDQMFGDAGRDRMFGCDLTTTNCGGLPDRDMMRGGRGEDYMEGNADVDRMFGDAGQDDMIGGSAVPGYADAGDMMFGNAGQDVLVGDNAAIERTGEVDAADGTEVRVVTLFDLNCPQGVGGNDVMNGNTANDDLFGGCADDLMHGDDGDDYLEGNPGGDTMFGDAGQDDLLGGTAMPGITDADDHIRGGNGTEDLPDDFDVILGDNGSVVRPVGDDGRWIVNTFNDSVMREIWLYDVEMSEDGMIAAQPTLSPEAVGRRVEAQHTSRRKDRRASGNSRVSEIAPFRPLTGARSGTVTDAPFPSGDDRLYGEGSDDVMFGQGGDDFLSGGTGDDRMQGNAGDDELEGNEDDDDMVGGTGRINDDPATGTPGRIDGADIMFGDAGFDVMLGDNGAITRRLDDRGRWLRYPVPFNGVIRDVFRFDDLDGIGGDDRMFGGGEDDILHGQRGNDEIDGGARDDELFGELGDDTLTGGTGHDVMLGDVGRVARLIGAGGAPVTKRNGAWQKDVLLVDVAMITQLVIPTDVPLLDPTNPLSPAVTAADVAIVTPFVDDEGEPRVESDFADRRILLGTFLAGGDDVMHGNDGDDVMLGQPGNDRMTGGAGRDYMEGDAGHDTLAGGDDGDWLIGDVGVNVLPFPTEPPHLLHGVDIIPAPDVDLGDFSQARAPLVTLIPFVVHHEPDVRVVVAQDFTVEDFERVMHDLSDSEAHLRHLTYATARMDRVAGDDVLSGGAAADLIVGDHATLVGPTAVFKDKHDDDDDYDDDEFRLMKPKSLATLPRTVHELFIMLHGDPPPHHDDDGDDHEGDHDDGDDDDDDRPHPLHRVDLLAGRDEIDGGLGQDRIAGDDIYVVAPLARRGQLPDEEHSEDEEREHSHDGTVVHFVRVAAGDDNIIGNDGDDIIVGDRAGLLVVDTTLRIDGHNHDDDDMIRLPGLYRVGDDDDGTLNAVASRSIREFEPLLLGQPQVYPRSVDDDDHFAESAVSSDARSIGRVWDMPNPADDAPITANGLPDAGGAEALRAIVPVGVRPGTYGRLTRSAQRKRGSPIHQAAAAAVPTQVELAASGDDDDDDDPRSGIHYIVGDDVLAGGLGDDLVLGDDGTVFTPLAVIERDSRSSEGGLGVIARAFLHRGTDDDSAPCESHDDDHESDHDDGGTSGSVAGDDDDDHDHPFPEPDNDVINGNEGDDTLFGQVGHDLVRGDDGDDIIDGGAGCNTLQGDAGSDVFLDHEHEDDDHEDGHYGDDHHRHDRTDFDPSQDRFVDRDHDDHDDHEGALIAGRPAAVRWIVELIDEVLDADLRLDPDVLVKLLLGEDDD